VLKGRITTGDKSIKSMVALIIATVIFLPITLLFSINQSNASADKEIYAFTYSRK
jgi:hypothetical protein